MKNIVLALLLLITSVFIKTDTVVSRFKIPASYQQITVQPGSFAQWLQNRTLKPAGTPTRTYTGTIARTNPYTAAVLNMSIGNQDLQQCADAVMRLRAEYLYSKKDYKAISFNFTSGFKCDFIHFAEGYRYQQSGVWKKQAAKDYSYASFLRYMNLVFSYAGTLSLDKELHQVTNANDLNIGDVFIKGGSPGHCFIVMNVVINKVNHQKRFLLAQSFMPAQNIQILQNGSPWFSLDEPAQIPYGELVSAAYLKRF
ncbi:DUF4846 domain-containing protein [Mucilaginibacter sp. PAMB04168]|uniref:DUF4846 domain-containing protein n=1 Tax=Mucilaginibacter sp. PAMB04168 TaxID=3138567 RepID=UPI0031F5FDA6